MTMPYAICDGCEYAEDDEEHECSGMNAIVDGVETDCPCGCSCNMVTVNIAFMDLEDLHRHWIQVQMLNPN
jgi:hypothetical protein